MANHTPDEQMVAKVKKMLGMTVDQWNSWMIGFLIVAAVAGAGSIVSQVVITKLQKAEALQAARELDLYKAGVAEKVADARKEGVEAGRAASDAMLRAASLEKEAAFARRETERLKSAVTWRIIPTEMATKLTDSLKGSAGRVNLRYYVGDPEALYFVVQFSEIFKRAGWQIGAGAVNPGNGIFFGIAISDSKTPSGVSLQQAFNSAQLPFVEAEIPYGGGFNMMTLQDAPTLMIGSREPALMQQ